MNASQSVPPLRIAAGNQGRSSSSISCRRRMPDRSRLRSASGHADCGSCQYVASSEDVMPAAQENREETLRWAVLATHLNGALDTGKYDHITPGDVLRHVLAGDLLEYLRHELDHDVSYA